MNNTNLFGDEIKPAKAENSQRPIEQLVSPLTQTFNEDCMVVMSRYPDKYFDLACVDVPYGINIETSGTYFKQFETKGWDNAIPSAG